MNRLILDKYQTEYLSTEILVSLQFQPCKSQLHTVWTMQYMLQSLMTFLAFSLLIRCYKGKLSMFSFGYCITFYLQAYA